MNPSMRCVCQTECLLDNDSHAGQNVENLAKNKYLNVTILHWPGSCCTAERMAFFLIVMPCDKQILAVWCFDSCVVEEILIPGLFKETLFYTDIIQIHVAGCVAENIHSREYSTKPKLPSS